MLFLVERAVTLYRVLMGSGSCVQYLNNITRDKYPTMTPGKRLEEWRAKQPSREAQCPSCGTTFTTQFGTYCSATCKAKAHKQRTRAALIEETGPLHCNWCSTPLSPKLKLDRKFCCKEHSALFFSAKRSGRPIRVQVLPNLYIETRDYSRIHQLRKEWIERESRPKLK